MRRSTAIALLLLLASAGPALGANCGGAVPCKCGDTVTSSYSLSADLGPCPGHGLQVKSHVTLDCRGHRITGSGSGSDRYGVYVRGDTGAEVRGATVRNCNLTGFYHGIRLRAAEGNQILNNRTWANGNFSSHAGYGIDVTVGSRNNLIQGNVIDGNADEGIHLASGTSANQLVDNVLFDNYLEQIYIFESHGNVLIGNTTYGTGSNSLYLKDSSDNHLEGNTFRDRRARVTGDATGNVFLENDFVNAELQFRVYDASPNRVPTENTVIGGSVRHPSGSCLRLTSTRDNTIADVRLDECGTDVVSEGSGAEPSANTLISTPLRKVSVDGSSDLATGWWLTMRVEDPAGRPIGGARVRAVDALGATVFDRVTDAAGELEVQPLVEKVRRGSATTSRTPHTLTTTRAGYQADVRAVEVTRDTTLAVVLTGSGGGDGGGGGGGAGDGGDPDGDGGGPGGPGSFSDNFARADSTHLGNGWAEVIGDLVLGDDGLLAGPVKGYSVAHLPALAGATQEADADFTPARSDARPRLGIVLRYRDPENYYAAYRQLGSDALRIVRVLGGKEKILAAGPVEKGLAGVLFRLGARAEGSVLTLTLNGVDRLTAEDSTFADGSVGLLIGSKSPASPHRADRFTATVQ